MYETVITVIITNKINHEILRKYLNSLSDNGFSGVSSGHKQKMPIAEITVIVTSAI